MATWAAHTIPDEVLKGLSRADWNSPNQLNQTKDADVEDQAKRTFITHVMDKSADVVLKEGGEVAFFDKVADEPALADRTNQGLGHLFWFHYYGDGASKAGTGETLEKKRDFHKGQAKMAVNAFCKTAPVVIGTYENRDRQAANTSIVTSYDRRGGRNIIAS